MMFIIKAVAFILLSLNIVSCSELSSDAKKQEQSDSRSPKRLQRYNQQESISIPVAVVFDDTDDRKGKSIDTIVSKANTNISPEKDKAEKKSNTPTLITLNSDFAVKSSESNNDNSKQSQANIKNENDLRIPVAVVYDEAPVAPAMKKKVLLRRKQGHHLQAGSQTGTVSKTTTQSPKNEENKIMKNNEEIKNISISEKALSRQTSNHDSKNQSRTRERDPVIPIIQSENRVFAHNGDFHYSYEGGDGTKAFETGELKSFDDNKTGEAVKGGFSYTDKDGQDYSLTYTADENGYRPVGAHLPTPPPIPPAIERALRYLATKTTPETVTDSSKSI